MRPPDASREAMATLASGLNSLEPEPAGVASRVVGAMIEAGHDPRPARPAMVGALQQTLPVCADIADEARAEIGEPPEHLDEDETEEWLAERAAEALNEAAGRRPAAATAWQRLHEVWPGAIALFSVDPEARAEAQELAPIAERIEDVHEAAGWLRAMLTVLHDEPYVVIEPATRTGIVGRMSGIVENFQLTTLLMDEFPRDEPRVSKAAVAVARGEGPQQIDETVTGIWNLFTYEALQPGDELPDPADMSLQPHMDLERGHARRHPGGRRPSGDPDRPGVLHPPVAGAADVPQAAGEADRRPARRRRDRRVADEDRGGAAAPVGPLTPGGRPTRTARSGRAA